MKWLKRKFAVIPAVIDALKKSPDTVKYPFSPVELPDSYRGELLLNPESCTGCGLCVKDCPADALVLEKISREKFRLVYYPARCAFCGQCEDNCIRGAIYNSRRFVQSTDNLEKLIRVLKDTIRHSDL